MLQTLSRFRHHASLRLEDFVDKISSMADDLRDIGGVGVIPAEPSDVRPQIGVAFFHCDAKNGDDIPIGVFKTSKGKYLISHLCVGFRTTYDSRLGSQ